MTVLHNQAETFRTDQVSRSQRLSYWNDVATSTFGDISVDALDEEFSGELRRLRLGGLTLAGVVSSPACVQGARTRSDVSDGWFLLLNERGTSRLSQGAREVSLGPGELTALRADERYRIEFSRPNKTIVLHLPQAPHIDLDRHVAQRHGPNDAPLFAAFMRQLEYTEPQRAPQRLEQLAIDIARLSWPAPVRSTRRQSMVAWEHHVSRYVQQNLDDPELSAAAIAQRFGITTRFVHMVFAQMGATTASFILQQRLSRAAARLCSDPAARVTDVALAAGFSDLSHFCRSFRRHFGTSAGRYRRAR